MIHINIEFVSDRQEQTKIGNKIISNWAVGFQKRMHSYILV